MATMSPLLIPADAAAPLVTIEDARYVSKIAPPLLVSMVSNLWRPEYSRKKAILWQRIKHTMIFGIFAAGGFESEHEVGQCLL